MRLSRLLRYMLGSEQAFELKEQLILRDHLALVRTRLANESTLLSYVRSSLYLLIGGIALMQVEGPRDLRYLGYIALALSAVFLVIGLYRYYTLRRSLNRYYARAMDAASRTTHTGPGQ
jgi:putative membrane protein